VEDSHPPILGHGGAGVPRRKWISRVRREGLSEGWWIYLTTGSSIAAGETGENFLSPGL